MTSFNLISLKVPSKYYTTGVRASTYEFWGAYTSVHILYDYIT